MRVNDVSTINLGHFDVHEIIMGCANSFVFGVRRRGEECESEEAESSNQTNDAANDELNDEKSNGSTNDEIVNGDLNILSVENGVTGTIGYEPVDEQTLFERIQSPASQTQSDVSAVTVQSNNVDSIKSVVHQRLGPVPFTNGYKKPEKEVENPPDELELQIAEIMSGEAEVLKEHNNVIG